MSRGVWLVAAIEALTHWLALRPQVPGLLTQPVPGASSLSLALFPGRFGTRLTARSVAQRLRRRSLLAGLVLWGPGRWSADAVIGPRFVPGRPALA